MHLPGVRVLAYLASGWFGLLASPLVCSPGIWFFPASQVRVLGELEEVPFGSIRGLDLAGPCLEFSDSIRVSPSSGVASAAVPPLAVPEGVPDHLAFAQEAIREFELRHAGLSTELGLASVSVLVPLGQSLLPLSSDRWVGSRRALSWLLCLWLPLRVFRGSVLWRLLEPLARCIHRRLVSQLGLCDQCSPSWPGTVVSVALSGSQHSRGSTIRIH